MSNAEKMVVVPVAEIEAACERFSKAQIFDFAKRMRVLLDQPAQPAQQGQGEPVALPARRDEVQGDEFRRGSAHGFNACLVTISKLGPLYTHADPAEVERLIADCWAACGGKGDVSRESLLTALRAMNDAEDEQDAEVERLRDELGEAKGEYDRSANKVAALRAQLAERDVLLRRALSGGDDSLGLDIDAALSASAEPSAPVEIDERAENSERYLWLKENVSGGSLGIPGGWIDDETEHWDRIIDAERKP